MLKRWLTQRVPDATTLCQHKRLRFLGEALHRPYLWVMNRRSLAMACAIGLFVAFIPVPGQMALAALGAVWFHGNLPVSVALVWLTNPVTMPPIFYLTYKLGTWLLQIPPGDFHFEATLTWFVNSLQTVLPPFLLGCLVCACLFSAMGYVLMHSLWRWRVANRWRARNICNEGD